MEGEMMNGGACKCPHHKVLPGLFFLFGLLFLLHNVFGMFSEDFVGQAWPVLVTLGGLMKLSKGMCKCCDGGMCKGGCC